MASISAHDFVAPSGETLRFTRMGCGGAPFGNLFADLSDTDVRNLVEAAWNAGIRYFDTAPQYGHGLSEQRLGPALCHYPRNEFLLSTKVGKLIVSDPDGVAADPLFHPGPPPRRITYDYSYDGVMRSFEESLRRLGHDRVDILVVHDVDGFTHGSREASERRIRELIDQGGWRALDALRASGTVKAIGAGVNEWEPCARLLELADPDLFLLAGRYTLLEQTPLHTLFPQCTRRGVGIIVGGPFNSGVLARRGGAFNYGPAPATVIARAERLRETCERFGVHLADAAIQFLLASPNVISVLPGHSNPHELAANVASLNARTPAELWSSLRTEGLIDVQAPTPGGDA
jgi:D-threo-aldose 1-dehydrogenase